jgi:hypothetical protein
MIIEDYCSFETAMLLKEKGFNAEIKMYWNRDYKNNPIINRCPCPFDEFEPDGIKTIDIDNSGKSCDSNHWWHPEEFDCIAPTIQMAMKWLRENHLLHIVAYPNQRIDNLEWIVTIYDEDTYATTHNWHSASYEQACETAICYILENLI